MKAQRYPLFALLSFALGCSGQSGDPSLMADLGAVSTTDPNRPPDGSPSDFFPTKTGSRWVYNVTLASSAEPLDFHPVSWPTEDGKSITYEYRGFLARRARLKAGAAGKTLKLELCVEGPAPQQGPLRYPKSVEVAVVRDDLGIYAGHKRLFWAITNAGEVTRVTIYDPESAGAPSRGRFGSWGQSDGYSTSLQFIVRRPMTELSAVGSGESLLFLGVERGVPGFEKMECLHFRRSVEAIKPGKDRAHSGLGQGFTEDTWYGRDRGLVKLEQKVEGKISMAWVLSSFVSD